MEIQNCTVADIDAILQLHEAARKLQTEKGMVVWPLFDRSMIENDIAEQRQWKLLTDEQIACTWTVIFADKEIWGELDQDNSIYLHRIATNPAMRGTRFIDAISKWSKDYAASLNRKYIRLDTLGKNTRLIELYTSAGFDFLGVTTLTDVDALPEHYHKERNCLRFEMKAF